MQTNGHFAEYDGEAYPEISSDAHSVVIAVPEDALAHISDALESGVGRRGGWARLPKDCLSRRVALTVWVRWQGEEFTVARVDGEQALLYYEGGDAARAEELGMEGSNYMGWSVTAPVSELELIRLDERQFA